MTATAPTPFPAFALLQEAHLQLVEETQDVDPTPERDERIKQFLLQAGATGVNLSRREERQKAQRILDYWAATLYQSGNRPDRITLAAWDKEMAPALGEEDFPYKPENAFRPTDEDEPIGWTLLLERCLEVLRDGKPVLAIVGPRRSGRSYLLRSGLIPALKGGTEQGRKTTNPWQCLPVFVPSESAVNYLQRLLGSAPTTGRVLLPIDNLENLFTNCTRADVETFLKFLLDWASADRQVALTLTSDSLAYLRDGEPGSSHVRLLNLVMDGSVRIAFDTEELRRIIELPARRVGLVFQDGKLIDQILRDVQGDPSALPLLQFTLRQLWSHREGNVITWQSYLNAGSGRTALANVAESCYRQLQGTGGKNQSLSGPYSTAGRARLD